MAFNPNKLKYTKYFFTDVLVKRPYLTEEMIENVLIHFEEEEIQINKRISYFGYEPNLKKYLRVVVEIDKNTNEKLIHNAYPDRTFTKKKRGKI